MAHRKAAIKGFSQGVDQGVDYPTWGEMIARARLRARRGVAARNDLAFPTVSSGGRMVAVRC